MKFNYIVVLAVAVVAAVGVGAVVLSDGDGPDGITVDLTKDAGIESVGGEGTYTQGDLVVLSAELVPGYSFDGWYGPDGELYSDRQRTECTPGDSLVLEARTAPEFTLHALGMFGVTTTGIETYPTDDEYGDVWLYECVQGCFQGWFDLDGNSYGTDMDLRPDVGDLVVVAYTDIDAFSGDNELTAENYPAWYADDSYTIVLDSYTGHYVTSFQGRNDAAIGLADGSYDVCYYNGLYDASAEYEVETVTFGTSAEHVFAWNYDGTDYMVSMDVPRDVYLEYRDLDVAHEGGPDELSSLVVYDDPLIVRMAGMLKEMSGGMDDLDRANLVLKFVQLTTEYQYDYVYNGCEEYFKHPVVTMLEGRGDCEDTAILYVALMKAMGYDAVLLDYDSEEVMEMLGMGHEAAGVGLDHVEGGSYYEEDGVKYYYCETTGDVAGVGDNWDGFGDTTIIHIP